MAYPSTLDVFGTKTDGVNSVLAAHVNALQTSVVAVQAKLGINNSAVASTLDYLVRNAASLNPGHRHSDASIESVGYGKLAYAGLTERHALIASSPTAAAFRAITEVDIADGSLLARLAANETITGGWIFNGAQRPLFRQGIELSGPSGEAIRHIAKTGGTPATYKWPGLGSPGQVLSMLTDGDLDWVDGGAGGGGGVITSAMGVERRNDHLEAVVNTVSGQSFVATSIAKPVGAILERVCIKTNVAVPGGYLVGVSGIPSLYATMPGTALETNIAHADDRAAAELGLPTPPATDPTTLPLRITHASGLFTDPVGQVQITMWFVRITIP